MHEALPSFGCACRRPPQCLLRHAASSAAQVDHGRAALNRKIKQQCGEATGRVMWYTAHLRHSPGMPPTPLSVPPHPLHAHPTPLGHAPCPRCHDFGLACSTPSSNYRTVRCAVDQGNNCDFELSLPLHTQFTLHTSHLAIDHSPSHLASSHPDRHVVQRVLICPLPLTCPASASVTSPLLESQYVDYLFGFLSHLSPSSLPPRVCPLEFAVYYSQRHRLPQQGLLPSLGAIHALVGVPYIQSGCA